MPGPDLTDPNGVAADDWRDTIVARVERQARIRSSKHGHARGPRILVQVGHEFSAALSRAAQLRGISKIGYMRRAIGAFVAADLHMDFHTLMGDTAMPRPNGNRIVVSLPGKADDDGHGYGTWNVASGQVGDGQPPQAVLDAWEKRRGR